MSYNDRQLPAVWIVLKNEVIFVEKPLYQTKDFDKIQRIYVLLGPACNMQCRHCSQMPVKNESFSINSLNPKVMEMLEHYTESILKDKKSKRILFWGGEPLLHWDFIKEVVKHLTDKFNLLSYNVTYGLIFGFTTNGLLLDKEKIDFCNQYRVRIALSYDAPYPFAVRGKISNEICELTKKAKYFGTISSFNALNTDFYLALRCLNKKFPKVYHRLNIGLMQTFAMPQDIIDYKVNDIKISVKKLCLAARLGDTESARIIFELTAPLYYEIKNSVFKQKWIKGCFSGLSSIAVKPNGEIMACHNGIEKTGTINDTMDTVYKNGLELYVQRASTLCKECEHNDICTGKCTYSQKENTDEIITCTRFWKPFYNELKKEFLKFQEPVSDEERKWFVEQYNRDNKIVENF